MVKKRSSKKRIIKKKIIKREYIKDMKDKLSSAVNNNMSKLEYEQALMDPRFRAAMIGFNNPGFNNAYQLNKSLHDKESKNNILTREISLQNDLLNQKQREIKLKDELYETKLKNKEEISKLQYDNAAKLKQSEINSLKQKFKYDTDISTLNSEIADQRRINQEQQKRYEQQEEYSNAKHELLINSLNDAHAQELHNIKELTRDLVRKQDIDNLQFSAAQDIADATLKKNIAYINESLAEKLHPLQEATSQAKREMNLAQTIHDANIKLNDTVTNNLIASFQNATQPIINHISLQNQQMDDRLKLLDTKINAIKSIKQAKQQLDQLTIKSITEPIQQRLEIYNQELKGALDNNKQIFDEIRKQKDLIIQNKQLEQIVDPHERDRYNEQLKNYKLQTNQLQLINSHAQSANDAYNETENIRKQIIANCAKILPNFNIGDIDKKGFIKILNDKESELRKEYAQLISQKELSDRLLDYKQQIHKNNIEYEENKARIDSLDNPTNDYKEAINKAAATKAKVETETERLELINNTINNSNNENYAKFDKAVIAQQQLLAANPIFKEIAEKYHLKKYGTKTIDPDHFSEIISLRDRIINTTGREIFNNPNALFVDKYGDRILALAQDIKNDGYNFGNGIIEGQERFAKQEKATLAQLKDTQSRLVQMKQFYDIFVDNEGNIDLQQVGERIGIPSVKEFFEYIDNLPREDNTNINNNAVDDEV